MFGDFLHLFIFNLIISAFMFTISFLVLTFGFFGSYFFVFFQGIGNEVTDWTLLISSVSTEWYKFPFGTIFISNAFIYVLIFIQFYIIILFLTILSL